MDLAATTDVRRSSRRMAVLVLALVQLAGAVVLPAADGLMDVERYGTPVHVESGGRDDCTPHHDHAFCQVVRSTAMANPAGPTTEFVVEPSRRVALALPERDAVPGHAAVLPGSSGPRAPPTA